VTYLDFALNGRLVSDTPGETVEKLSEPKHLRPGDQNTRPTAF
jgi:hypothetical protein